MDSVKLKLELEDALIIGEYGDFGRAKSPLEDEITKIMIGVSSGALELTLVDLDGDYNGINIYQLQDNVSEDQVRAFVIENINSIVEWVDNQISNKISELHY